MVADYNYILKALYFSYRHNNNDECGMCVFCRVYIQSVDYLVFGDAGSWYLFHFLLLSFLLQTRYDMIKKEEERERERQTWKGGSWGKTES